jgi:hypothetical protein
MAADSDSSVRLDLMKLATELVNDRSENRREHLENEALLDGGDGTYAAIEDNRAAEIVRITNALFSLYQPNGGKEMLDAIEQAFEMANDKYTTELTRRRFNAIKTDPTGTEILSRVSYDMPNDLREQDIYNLANQLHTTLVSGGPGELKVIFQTEQLGQDVEQQQSIVPDSSVVTDTTKQHLAF